MGTIYLAILLYVLYVVVKFGVFYFTLRKLEKRKAKEKPKIRRRKIRVRETRPDRSSFPF